MTTIEDYLAKTARYEGVAEGRDVDRLIGQTLRVYHALRDNGWLTLSEIRHITGDPEASISAQIRHLRKPRFGGHVIEKRRRNDGAQWEYMLGKEQQ